MGPHEGVVVERVFCKGAEDECAAAAGIAAEQDLSRARDAVFWVYQQRPPQLGNLRLQGHFP